MSLHKGYTVKLDIEGINVSVSLESAQAKVTSGAYDDLETAACAHARERLHHAINSLIGPDYDEVNVVEIREWSFND